MERRALLITAALCLGACHGFDHDQVPVIRVGGGLRPAISWTPATAYELRVYLGDEEGDRSDVIAAQGVVPPVWFARGAGGHENALSSPVTYGVTPPGPDVAPAPPLEPGKTYTVTVYRVDEAGGGEGFFNTRNRYDGILTFVARE